MKFTGIRNGRLIIGVQRSSVKQGDGTNRSLLFNGRKGLRRQLPFVQVDAQTPSLNRRIRVREFVGFFDGGGLEDENSTQIGVLEEGTSRHKFAHLMEAADVLQVRIL